MSFRFPLNLSPQLVSRVHLSLSIRSDIPPKIRERVSDFRGASWHQDYDLSVDAVYRSHRSPVPLQFYCNHPHLSSSVYLSQDDCPFSFSYTELNLLTIIVIGSARNTIPDVSTMLPTNFPPGVDGTTSPYPTVVMVTMLHQHPCMIEVNISGLLSFSV